LRVLCKHLLAVRIARALNTTDIQFLTTDGFISAAAGALALNSENR